MTIKECFILGMVILMLGGGAFGTGVYVGEKNPECVVGYDDPAGKCIFADGSMKVWFGGDFSLAPGESVRIDALSGEWVEDGSAPGHDTDIHIAIHPNEALRTYHVRFRDFTEQEMDIVSSIPGVIEGKFRGEEYELRIERGLAFGWVEIEPQIIILLEAHPNPQNGLNGQEEPK